MEPDKDAVIERLEKELSWAKSKIDLAHEELFDADREQRDTFAAAAGWDREC